MDFVLDAYCGLYCGACPNMLVARTEMGSNPCYGCKSEQPTGYCATCELRSCAKSKGYEYCYQCDHSSTCIQLQKFKSEALLPTRQNVLKNMEIIKIEGKEKWLKVQDKRWRCENCDAPFTWFDETCPQCGRTVAIYKVDK